MNQTPAILAALDNKAGVGLEVAVTLCRPAMKVPDDVNVITVDFLRGWH